MVLDTSSPPSTAVSLASTGSPAGTAGPASTFRSAVAFLVVDSRFELLLPRRRPS
jgi:hypothetical protein